MSPEDSSQTCSLVVTTVIILIMQGGINGRERSEHSDQGPIQQRSVGGKLVSPEFILFSLSINSIRLISMTTVPLLPTQARNDLDSNSGSPIVENSHRTCMVQRRKTYNFTKSPVGSCSTHSISYIDKTPH